MDVDLTTITDDDWAQLEALAKASTPLALSYGQWETETIEQALAWFRESMSYGDHVQPWTVHAERSERGPLTICVTGNGPTSEANAKFFTVARTAVLALLQRARSAERALVRLHGAAKTVYDTAMEMGPEYLDNEVWDFLDQTLAEAAITNKEAQDAQ